MTSSSPHQRPLYLSVCNSQCVCFVFEPVLLMATRELTWFQALLPGTVKSKVSSSKEEGGNMTIGQQPTVLAMGLYGKAKEESYNSNLALLIVGIISNIVLVGYLQPADHRKQGKFYQEKNLFLISARYCHHYLGEVGGGPYSSFTYWSDLSLQPWTVKVDMMETAGNFSQPDSIHIVRSSKKPSLMQSNRLMKFQPNTTLPNISMLPQRKVKEVGFPY